MPDNLEFFGAVIAWAVVTLALHIDNRRQVRRLVGLHAELMGRIALLLEALEREQQDRHHHR